MSPTLASPASTPIAPADMVGFGKLVVRAREKQHGSLTYKQYAKLLSRFIGLQPKPQAGLLMGRYLFHQRCLAAPPGLPVSARSSAWC